jgi:hypothetical protein
LPTAIGAADVTISGPNNQANAQFPHKLTVGDINGDGLVDLVAGTRFYTKTTSREGAVTVYLGRRMWPSDVTVADIHIDSPAGSMDGFFGRGVAACDLDGDGIDDIVGGASGVSSSQGAAYVFLGRGSWPSTLSAADSTLPNPDPQPSQFGRTLACLGTMDSNPAADIVIGAVDHDNPEVNEGSAFLYLGRTSWPSSVASADSVFDNPVDQGGAAFGEGISTGKDMDGDGLTELAVGAKVLDTAFVFFGRPTWGASITAVEVRFDNPDATDADFGDFIN